MVPSTTQPSGTAQGVLNRARRATPTTVWLGGFTDPSGHADELRGFMRALEAHGCAPIARDVRWTEVNAGLSASELEQIERQKRRKATGPFVAIHEYLPSVGQWIIPRAPNVARVMFETDRAPRKWLGSLLARDEVWVPSQFNVETFARSGVPEEKMRTLGGTLDFDLFDPAIEPLDLGAPAGAFTFLTNFDFSERKGWRQLLHAWARAFDRHDDVCLVLKTGSFYTGDDTVEARIEKFLREEIDPAVRERMAPMRIMCDRLTVAAMPTLYAGADAYVLPSRGEGWGRPYMEALAMGLPTIASRFSGNLEFMDDDTSWLVDGELVPVPDDAEVFNDLYRGHKWFEADADDLAAKMREIASDPTAARAKAAPGRADLIRRFGPEAIARRVTELATDLLEREGPRRAKPVYAVVRGRYGSVDSLAVVNDGLVGELMARGENVQCIAPEKPKPVPEPAPTVSQSWPPVFEPASEGPTVTVLHWEFGAPPREWVDEIRRKVDRVWVASDYVRRGYIEGGIPAGVVETIPCGANLDSFNPNGPAYGLPRSAGTTFLFVGGTTWRKGADILLEGWRRAFGPDDDVQLVVKDFGVGGAYRNQTMGEAFRQVAASGQTAPIAYIDDELPFAELPSLYRAADVVVLPYRAEGFCLPALEAMACGVPVIHTGEGPTGEFVGDAGGWALPARRAPLPDGIQLPELSIPGWVHEVDPAELAERLRAVAADDADRRERGARAVEQARRYTWARFADAAKESLARLQAEGLPLARNLRRAEIEARTHYAVYAPDWGEDAVWARALDAWIGAFGPDDDVTLALFVDGDADAIGAKIMGHLNGRDPSTLPDLALVAPGDATLTALAASADAVLTDGATDPAERPALLRRARRIVPAEPAAVAELCRLMRG